MQPHIVATPYGWGRCIAVGGWPSLLFVSMNIERYWEVADMVTYESLFTFLLVLISFAGLIIQISKKK